MCEMEKKSNLRYYPVMDSCFQIVVQRMKIAFLYQNNKLFFLVFEVSIISQQIYPQIFSLNNSYYKLLYAYQTNSIG